MGRLSKTFCVILGPKIFGAGLGRAPYTQAHGRSDPHPPVLRIKTINGPAIHRNNNAKEQRNIARYATMPFTQMMHGFEGPGIYEAVSQVCEIAGIDGSGTLSRIAGCATYN